MFNFFFQKFFTIYIRMRILHTTKGKYIKNLNNNDKFIKTSVFNDEHFKIINKELVSYVDEQKRQHIINEVYRKKN